MALAHRSIATISSPEFINLQPIDLNPLMSSCEIKIFYLGQNRNGSYISKEVATQMAKTLRGAPIVGYYKTEKDDFADHGQQMIWDDTGIHFNCLTKPYGFVSPDAKVWFKDFEDSDEFGNTVVRTYLMTTGFLWTGQFEQAQKIYEDEGKPHSMELDENNISGHWAKNLKQNMEFFIIDDAIFSKLCILGDDVQPCFEGSAVTSPEISASFALNDDFKKSLFSMMKDLKEVLKGGKSNLENQVKNFAHQDKNEQNTIEKNNISVEQENSTFEKKNNVNEDSVSSNSAEVIENNSTSDSEDNNSNSSDNNDSNNDSSDDTSFEKKDEEKEESKEKEESNGKQKENQDEEKKKYTKSLEDKIDLLNQEIQQLRAFKLKIENQKKDELINKFSVLSEEDKKDVIENKEKYSLEQIESKLAVICFRKQVNFSTVQKNETKQNQKTEDKIITFNSNINDNVPDWVKEVEQVMNNKYN